MAKRAEVPALASIVTGSRQDLEDDRSDAQRRGDRIRAIAHGVADDLARLLDLIREAKASDDHVVLGYASWTAYMSDLFGAEPLRLTRDLRQEFVAELSTLGMSTRAIAPMVGVDQKTISNDIRREESSSPEPRPVVQVITADAATGEVIDPPRVIEGRDGKTYTPPAPREVDPAADIERVITEAERLATRTVDMPVTAVPADRAADLAERLARAANTLRALAHLIEGQA